MSAQKNTASENESAEAAKDIAATAVEPIQPNRGMFWIALTLLVGWLCYLAYLSFA